MSLGVYECEAMLVISASLAVLWDQNAPFWGRQIRFEVLLRLMDGLRVSAGRRYWISEHVIEGNTCDMGEGIGPTVKEVKITFRMSHNTLTRVEKYAK